MTVRHIVAVGGSDAGISAALRARELDPTTDVTVVVADAYPNFSICGIPYYVSGEVTHWTNLAHRTTADLATTGMQVLTDTRATRINVEEHTLDILDSTGAPQQLPYDALIVGTGAISARPPIHRLNSPDALGPADGVHLLHSMGDTFAVMAFLQERDPATAVIVGAGYIGLEMAEALTIRGIRVTQIEALPEVLPTVDPELGGLVHAELECHGVEVLINTAVTAITRTDTGAITVTANHDGHSISRTVDFVLVVVGVRPDTELAADAGAHLGVKGAVVVDEAMRTNLPDIFAAGDCEVAVLADAVERNGTVVKFLAYTGLRWGEMAALRVQDFDMLRRRVNVSRSVTESGGLVWSTPKTHERRSVPFPAALADELSTLMLDKGRDDLVFNDMRGGVLRNSNWRARVFDLAVQACQKADESFPTITPHDLRHTAASLAVSAGANVKALQRMLGHAKASMTLDVYADLFDDDLDSVAESLDAAIVKASSAAIAAVSGGSPAPPLLPQGV